MKTVLFPGVHLALLLEASVFSVLPQSVQTNASIFAFAPWAGSVNREVDFMRSLFAETNRNFDQKVYASVKGGSKPIVISYQQISFVFHYPPGVAFVGSSTEMAQPDELLCSRENIIRRASTNEIPANYIRVMDIHRKNICADLDLLLGVAPQERPDDVKYVRRSFRFVYRDKWKED